MAEEHTVKISNELVQMCREGLLIACVLMKQYRECMIPEAPLIVKNPGDQETVAVHSSAMPRLPGGTQSSTALSWWRAKDIPRSSPALQQLHLMANGNTTDRNHSFQNA